MMRQYGKKALAVLLIFIMTAQMGILQLNAAASKSQEITGELSVKTEKSVLYTGEETDLWEEVTIEDSSGQIFNDNSEITEIQPDTYEKREPLAEGEKERYIFEQPGTYEITYTVRTEDTEKQAVRIVEAVEGAPDNEEKLTEDNAENNVETNIETDKKLACETVEETDETSGESQEIEAQPKETTEESQKPEEIVEEFPKVSEEDPEEPQKTSESQDQEERTEGVLPDSLEAASLLTDIPATADGISYRAGGTFQVHVDMNPSVGGSPEGTKILDIFRIKTSDSNWNNWWYMGYAVRWIASSQRYAYCFEAGQDSSNSDIYGNNGSKWASSALYSALAYAMAHGAQYLYEGCEDPQYSMNAKGTWPLDYAITQLVAHALIADPDLNPDSAHDQHGWSNEIKFTMADVQVAEDAKYYTEGTPIDYNNYKNQALATEKKFFNDAKAYGQWANNGYLDKIEFQVTTDSQPALNGSDYEADFTVTPTSTSRDGSTLDHSSEFDKSSLKLILKNAPSGAKITAVDTENGKYKITFPRSSVEAGKSYTITVEASGKFDRQKVMNYRSNNTNNQSMGFWEVTEEEVKDSTDFQLSVPAKLRLNVRKVWTGEWSQSYRPDKVKVELWRKTSADPEGKLVAGSYKTLTAENNWTLPDNDDWKNLAVTDSNGNPYIYFVKETVPSGYTFVSSTETSSSGTITITNEQKLISLTVEKSWIDNTSNLPDSIYVELWRKTELNPDGKLVSGSGKYLTAENGWKLPSNAIWEHLPVSDKNGNIYTYFVKETVPSGFTFVSTTYLNGEEVYQTSGHEGTITITNRSEDSPELKIRKADADNPEKGLQGARAYNQKLLEYSSIEQAVTEFEKNSEDYEQILNVNGDGIIGILEIPEVHIYLPVYHGTEKEVLRAGAGHYEGSSFPVGGESTHAVITGHRGLPSADLFTRLDEMEEGEWNEKTENVF